jgi:hypothetical protein
MVRGTPDTELVANISVDTPGFRDWIEVVEGKEIILPKGEQKVPMTVRVQVPEDAEFKDYEGRIRIRTQPSADQLKEGAVNISLGAQVDVELTVIDKVIEDFRVRRIDVSDLNEGSKMGWLYFPGRIKFGMFLENTGNVPVSPTRVTFDIYDTQGNVLLEETENLGDIKNIAPYATEEVTAAIPTRLPAGNYVARYEIFNGEEVKQSGQVNLSILEAGTLQTAGFGFRGLSLPHKISVVLPVLTVLILGIYIVYYIRLRRKRSTE